MNPKTIKIKLILFIIILFPQDIFASNTIDWQSFDKASFQKAKQQDKFILLDLVAVWCHWCHVMDKTTYQDDKVISLLNSHFITTQADHDLRPDLAERYRDWGWPATIIMTPDGTEVVKRAGYISPENMARLLQTIIEDPSPESSTLSLPKNLSKTPDLTTDLISQLKQMHLNGYDTKLGGLKLNMKFLDADSVEWDLALAQQGDTQARYRVIQTLKSAKKLIDPEFGGAYQYSTFADWEHPHYEKIINTQYKYLLVYSKACQFFNDESYCGEAQKIADFLLEFLYSPEKEVFYTSQDADLYQGEKSHGYFKLKRKERLALGIPKVDKHIYASHNGKAIAGFVHYYLASKNKKYLQLAIQATDWVIKNRSIENGGFKHDKRDTAGPYLADTLYMGRALLLLYQATNNDNYLNRAIEAADFIQTHFKNPQGGLVSAVDNGTPTQPLPQLDQNIDAARFLMNLYSEKRLAALKDSIIHSMKFLATSQITTSRFTEAGVLLAHVKYLELFK
jgi:uncharacterized protein YyaL (SSP411 family)